MTVHVSVVNGGTIVNKCVVVTENIKTCNKCLPGTFCQLAMLQYGLAYSDSIFRTVQVRTFEWPN